MKYITAASVWLYTDAVFIILLFTATTGRTYTLVHFDFPVKAGKRTLHFFNPAYKSLTLFDEYRHTGFCGRVALFEKGHIFYKCLNGKSCVTHTLDKLYGFAGILVLVTQSALCSRNRGQ